MDPKNTTKMVLLAYLQFNLQFDNVRASSEVDLNTVLKVSANIVKGIKLKFSRRRREIFFL